MEFRRLSKRSFEQVYQDNFSYVYNMVYVHVLSHAKAEELVSDIFFKAYSAFERFDAKKASERTWLASICRNHLIDYYRSAERQKLNYVDEEDFAHIPAEDAAIDSSLINADSLRQILSALTDDERALLSLRYFEEKSNAEIADILNISAKAVSERYRRLLAKCQQIAQNLNLMN